MTRHALSHKHSFMGHTEYQPGSLGLDMNIEHIWDRYRSSLKAFLYGRLSNHDDVVDLLQEILIKTHLGLHTIKSEDRIRPWLFQIAKNATIDFYRQRERRHALSPDDYWGMDDDPDLHKELASCLTPFLSALSPESSTLLTRFDLEGESQKAYAAKMGIPYSTLKSRVQKSRAELRALFEECCHFSLNRQGEIIDCDAKEGGCDRC